MTQETMKESPLEEEKAGASTESTPAEKAPEGKKTQKKEKKEKAPKKDKPAREKGVFPYLFIIYWITAAFVLAAGIWLLADRTHLLVYIVLGIFFILVGLARLIPLIKTSKTTSMKIINVVLLLLDAGLGVWLILTASKETTPDSLAKLFAYLMGLMLFANGVFTLFGSSLRHEPITLPSFILHVLYIALGSYFVGIGGIDVASISTTLAVVSFLITIYFIVIGMTAYRAYRVRLVKETEAASIEAVANASANAPANAPAPAPANASANASANDSASVVTPEQDSTRKDE